MILLDLSCPKHDGQNLLGRGSMVASLGSRAQKATILRSWMFYDVLESKRASDV